jgi:hypothetical protein
MIGRARVLLATALAVVWLAACEPSVDELVAKVRLSGDEWLVASSELLNERDPVEVRASLLRALAAASPQDRLRYGATRLLVELRVRTHGVEDGGPPDPELEEALFQAWVAAEPLELRQSVLRAWRRLDPSLRATLIARAVHRCRNDEEGVTAFVIRPWRTGLTPLARAHFREVFLPLLVREIERVGAFELGADLGVNRLHNYRAELTVAFLQAATDPELASLAAELTSHWPEHWRRLHCIGPAEFHHCRISNDENGVVLPHD